MAVRGFEGFRSRFQEYQNHYILIGGAACDLWFQQQDLNFRATQDIDMVLVMEALDTDFVRQLWNYLKEAGYQGLERNDDTSTRLYRFQKPKQKDVPVMIELLSRSPEAIFPEEDQKIVPIRMENAPSLSAILLNHAYYEFLLRHRIEIQSCPIADVHTLLLFKVRAWLDLTERKQKGDHGVKSTDIKKHRTDVFRLTATLTPGEIVTLPLELHRDLQHFLESFPPEADDWPAILAGLKSMGLGSLDSSALISTLKAVYYSWLTHPNRALH